MARRRKFSDEFKREAVRLATQSGVTKSQISRELGINANLLGRWVSRLCGQRCSGVSRAGQATRRGDGLAQA
jgi:transposase-like protein